MDYKKELLEMIQKMENIRFLAMAYGCLLYTSPSPRD